MIQDKIHEQIVQNCTAVASWFEKKSQGLKFPIYSSFDIRDSGLKIAPVDANIFPAGFNNICPTDKEHAPEILKKYLGQHYSKIGRNVLLLAEEHTQNAYYWENVATIFDLFRAAGCQVHITLPRYLSDLLTVKAASGREVQIHPSTLKDGFIYVGPNQIDLIVCNNDFSVSYEEWSRGLLTPMNPPKELGWYRRKKSSFFEKYNSLAREFASLLQLPDEVMTVDTELKTQIDVDDEDSREQLAQHVEKFLAQLKRKYEVSNIQTEPFCFIKNNSGTYGLAVVQVRSGQDVRDWNNKIRKKMKAAKGGREVSEFIIQEGIPTRFKDNSDGAAEPCIYMVGDHLVGGFLRTHFEKSELESLNSPGAVYKKLCMSDLEVDLKGCPMENVYGWVSKLSALALALEAKAAGVEFRNYELLPLKRD
jgi:glutamate--cysteine ligase